MSQPFGASFTSWFFPLIGQDPPADIAADAELVNIHVFGPDGIPSRDRLQSGEGSIATITTWEWDAIIQGYKFTVPAIDDPYPDSLTSIRAYWFAINLRLQTGEQIQPVLRTEYLERVKGPSQSVHVTEDDLFAIYNEIKSHSTPEQRETAIAQALLNVKAELKSKGYKWAQIHQHGELKNVVTLKALAILCLSKVQAGNDKFAIKYGEYNGMYRTQVDGLSLEYDSDGDGTPDVTVKASTGLILVQR